jgi:NAD+ diphosphatase
MSDPRRPQRNFFSAGGIDRASVRRQDEAWLAARLAHPSSRFIPVWRLQTLFAADADAEPIFLSAREAEALRPCADSTILLGLVEGRAYFAVGFPSEAPEPPTDLAELGQFQDLRRVAALLDREMGGLLAYARAMTYWHCRHRYCGVCGSPTVPIHAGFQRLCTEEACGQQHFPRTDPAIIVLIRSGGEGLLGRQPTWPAGMYSTIAGFVEPGESLEDAVRREVFEETGIRVESANYHSSQPWPFPSSLMLGFTGRAANHDIRLRDHELENARWFSRKGLRIGLQNGAVRLPSPYSISFRLIEDWFDAGRQGYLRKVAGLT